MAMQLWREIKEQGYPGGSGARVASEAGETQKARAGSHNPGQVRGFDAQEDLEELQEIVGQALSPIVIPASGVDDGRRSRSSVLR